MPELDPVITVDEVALEYPDLVLEDLPLEFGDERFGEMTSNERCFAELLIDRGMVVYWEPKVVGCNHVPDFFIINPFQDKGKLVEITLMKSDYTGVSRKTRCRKERQIQELENCGIPFVVLYRENMENVKKYHCHNLF